MPKQYIDTAKRLQLQNAIRQEFNASGKISMTFRAELAERFGMTVPAINRWVGNTHATHQRKWTDEELKDVWISYEAEGAKALAQKYNCTPHHIYTLINKMRHVDHDVSLPWQFKRRK